MQENKFKEIKDLILSVADSEKESIDNIKRKIEQGNIDEKEYNEIINNLCITHENFITLSQAYCAIDTIKQENAEKDATIARLQSELAEKKGELHKVSEEKDKLLQEMSTPSFIKKVNESNSGQTHPTQNKEKMPPINSLKETTTTH